MSDGAITVAPLAANDPSSSSSESPLGVQAVLDDALGVKVDAEVETKQVRSYTSAIISFTH